MDSVSLLNLFEFQNDTIQEIEKKFENSNIVKLEGGYLSGKSIVAQKINLLSYDKHYLNGNIENQTEALSVFKTSALYSKFRKKKDSMNDVSTIMTSFLGIDAAVNSIGRIINRRIPNDIKHIIDKISDKKTLIIADHINYFDSDSLMILKYIIKQLKENRISNLKLLLVCQEKDIISQEVECDSLNIGFFTESDCNHLKITSNIKFYNNLPIPIVLSFASDPQNENSINQFLTKEFASKLNQLNSSIETKSALKTIHFYQLSIKEIWIETAMIINFLYENKVYNPMFQLEILKKEKWIEISENKNFIKINDYYQKLLVESSFEEINDYELSFYYLDYLERNAHFLYSEKHYHYLRVKNIDLAKKNAFLAFSQIMREKGENIYTQQLIEFIRSNVQEDLFEAFEKTLIYYSSNSYEQAFTVAESFIENLQGHYYAYHIEVLAELAYIRALSLARMITIKNEESHTRKVEEQDIKFLIQISNVVKELNIELWARLQEAILILLNDFERIEEKTNFSDGSNFSVLNYFEKIHSVYQQQIATSKPKHVKYWQVRLATLLTKVEMVDKNSDFHTFPILQRAFEILRQYKEDYPKQYLRAACNHVGICYWNGYYKNALDIINEAIDFVEFSKDEINWGLLYQMKTIILLSLNKTSDEFLEFYETKVWNHESIRNRMHEKYISLSNYAVFLLSSEIKSNYQLSSEYLEESLKSCPETKVYDLYLLTTNLALAYYLLDRKKDAYTTEQKVAKLLEKKIPYLDGLFLEDRHKRLLEIYDNENSSLSFKDSLNLSIPSDKLGHFKNNYNHLWFVSDIVYWAN